MLDIQQQQQTAAAVAAAEAAAVATAKAAEESSKRPKQTFQPAPPPVCTNSMSAVSDRAQILRLVIYSLIINVTIGCYYFKVLRFEVYSEIHLSLLLRNISI